MKLVLFSFLSIILLTPAAKGEDAVLCKRISGFTLIKLVHTENGEFELHYVKRGGFRTVYACVRASALSFRCAREDEIREVELRTLPGRENAFCRVERR